MMNDEIVTFVKNGAQSIAKHCDEPCLIYGVTPDGVVLGSLLFVPAGIDPEQWLRTRRLDREERRREWERTHGD